MHFILSYLEYIFSFIDLFYILLKDWAGLLISYRLRKEKL